MLKDWVVIGAMCVAAIVLLAGSARVKTLANENAKLRQMCLVKP